MPEMTMRERMAAVIRGQQHDRVPFVQYGDLAGPREEIWAEIGRDAFGILKWVNAAEWVSDDCRIEEIPIERAGRGGTRQVLHTPAGELVAEVFREPTYGTRHIDKHFVTAPGDYRILLRYLRTVQVRASTEGIEAAIRDVGDDGLAHLNVGRTPFQQLWVQWVSLEDLCGHMADEPGLVEEVIAALAEIQRRHFDVACRFARDYPIHHVNVGDNITAPVIGERYFRKYCLPLYDELADRLAATGTGAIVSVHMDGDLRPLWRAIGESRVRLLDSLSPPPDNDTSIADAVRMWPEMRLWVNFPSSVHLAEPKRVYDHAMTILQEGGHTGRLQIQISENVPPGVWRKSFPQIARAIRDFGRP